MLSERDVIEVNKFFDKGAVVNRNSLHFAISSVETTKDWVTQLAYLLRSIVVDHVFEEGNKRTAVALFVAYCKYHKRAYDMYKIDLCIRDMIKKQITDIKKVRRLIKNAVI